MKNVKYLLDSVILIDHLNDIKAATDYFSNLKKGVAAISVVTLTEVLAGATDDEDDIFNFLGNFHCLSIDPVVAILATDFRRKYRLKLPDAFQAAIAKHYKLKLVTRNTKDFDSEKFDFVDVPYTV